MSRRQSYFFIIKKYLPPGKKTQSLCATGSFNFYIYLGSHSPPLRFFLFCGWCLLCGTMDDDIKNLQRRVLFLNIITDAAGPVGDCVHKGCRQSLRGKHLIRTPQRDRAFTPCVLNLGLLGRLWRYYSTAGDLKKSGPIKPIWLIEYSISKNSSAWQIQQSESLNWNQLSRHIELRFMMEWKC